ncbi:MAG: alpha/beta hydrolase [Lachnospiraceae bacterium]|nr:alpha/beta hydrolase [Lachnospiraceae bacterium]
MKIKEYKGLIFKLAAALSIISSAYVYAGWPFFHFITYAGGSRKGRGNENRKKWFSLKHTKINHPTYEHAREYREARDWCRKQKMEEWYIRSMDGLMLHASYLEALNPKRFVILCHGYRGSRFGSVANIAKYLHREGCNLLFIDQRCCGESDGKYITFGAKEQYDVIEWINRIQKENHKRLPIYLYGQSMGATSILLASGHSLPNEVKGIIADCGFHSMKQQLRDMASEWFHLKRIGILLFRVDLFCHIFGGFSMKDTDVTMALKLNQSPVLFFHGEKDTYVSPVNSIYNYELCKAEKELVMIPKSRHLCCSYDAPAYYRKKLMDFFGKYDKETV